MSVPAHCELMKPASEKFKEVLTSINIQKPLCDVLQNVDASASVDVDQIYENLIQQIYKPVQWTNIMNYFETISINKYVECGPSKVLSGLIKRGVKEASIISLDNYDSFLDMENLI